MKKGKYLPLFILIGWLYIGIEVTLRVVGGDPLTNGIWQPASLCGWASLWMFFVGGTAGTLLGGLDEVESFRRLPMIAQATCGGLIITFVEFWFGMVFNMGFGLALWDYSTWPFNLLGQISLFTSFIWFLASPLGLWVDNVIRFYLYQEEKPESLGSMYLRLFTLR